MSKLLHYDPDLNPPPLDLSKVKVLFLLLLFILLVLDPQRSITLILP